MTMYCIEIDTTTKEINPEIYRYNTTTGHMYRVAYPKPGQTNVLYKILPFKHECDYLVVDINTLTIDKQTNDITDVDMLKYKIVDIKHLCQKHLH